MAETFTRAVASELSCPVCLELFVPPYIPKDLPDCGHICCEICLKKLIDKSHGSCPECRTNVVRPKGGVSQFRTNLKVLNLAERYPKEMGKTHKMGEPICVEHDDAKMRYYCVSCNMLACQACILVKHKKGHVTKKVDERYNELQSQTTQCQEVVDECNNTVSKLNELKSTLQTKLEMHKEEVDVHFDECVRKVKEAMKEAGEQLKEQLETTTSLILKDIDQQIIDHTDNINIFEKIKEDAIESTENMSEADYILRHSAFSQKMETLKKENEKIEVNESAISVKFELHGAEKPICIGYTCIGRIMPAVQKKKRSVTERSVISCFINHEDTTKTIIRFQFQNVSQVRERKRLISPAHVFQNCPWKTIIQLTKRTKETEKIGLFLQCNGTSTSSTWSCQASATITLVDQNEGEDTSKKIVHKFHPKESDWGFSQFMDFEEFMDEDKGFVEDNSAIVQVEFKETKFEDT